MENLFHANAKLMISGEYLVIDGALALCVPLNVGQGLKVTEIEPNDDALIYWEAREMGESWFRATFSANDFSIRDTTDDSVAERLKLFFAAITEFAPGCFSKGKSYKFETNNEFKRQWGLGTSSALIANLSRWAGINPFDLHFSVSNSSGYDVATAMSGGPILYQVKNKVPSVRSANFYPPFSDQLYLVYLGNKLFSDSEVTRYEILKYPDK